MLAQQRKRCVEDERQSDRQPFIFFVRVRHEYDFVVGNKTALTFSQFYI